MIIEHTFIRKTGEYSSEYFTTSIKIDPNKSKLVQVMEYCWNFLPHGFKIF